MAQRGNPEKGGEASLHSKKVSAAELQLYLKGLNYPANRQKIMDTAKTNRAPKNVMDYIGKLPDGDYNSPVIVEEEFSKIKEEM